MHVLIAADIFPPISGGPATYAVLLADKLVAEGVSVTIVTLTPESETRLVSCPVFFVSKKKKSGRYAEYLWLLWKQSFDADIIYAMGPVNAGLPAWLVTRLRGKKFVVKVVGNYAWEQGVQRYGVTDTIDAFQRKKYQGVVRLLQMIQRWTVTHADAVITPSRYLQQLVAGWGATRINIIPNAVSVDKVVPMNKPIQERWLVSVGRLVPWKGMLGLIQTMPNILLACPEARLYIVGDGPERAVLEKEIRTRHLDQSVFLLGNCPKSETLSYLKAADAVVLNSSYEGLSHTLIEAVLLGTPVIASRVGGNEEVICHGKNGWLFPYNDDTAMTQQIITVLKGNRFLARESQAEDTQKFSVPAMVAKTKQLFESLCIR